MTRNISAKLMDSLILVANPNGLKRPDGWEKKVNETLLALGAEIDRLDGELNSAEARVNSAYYERNHLVAVLARIVDSGVKKKEIEGWPDEWHGCVYIDFPWGQGSWHYADAHAHLFEGIKPYELEWDGTTTEEKYSKMRKWLKDVRI